MMAGEEVDLSEVTKAELRAHLEKLRPGLEVHLDTTVMRLLLADALHRIKLLEDKCPS